MKYLEPSFKKEILMERTSTKGELLKVEAETMRRLDGFVRILKRYNADGYKVTQDILKIQDGFSGLQNELERVKPETDYL